MPRIGLDLGAQASDQPADQVPVLVVIVSPHALDQLLRRQNLPGVRS